MKLLISTSAAFKALACTVALLSAIGGAQAQADPSGRVARLNYISGNVTFAPAASDTWAYAELNRPLTVGDSVWADSGARAELHLGSTAVRLESMTSLNILDLTDDTAQLKLSQGSISVRVRSLPNNQSFEIDTPNLAFVIQEPGEYRLSVAADGSTIAVTVRQGIGIVYGDNDNLTVHENEQMVFSGTNLSQAALGTAAPYDSFDAWARDRDRAEEASTSARYVSREIIGYEQLDSYGTWSNDPEYGAVWAPRVVTAGWSPYRTGHWTWVAPWGWTWIDDAPWGFAPYHYGRWAYIHSGWCWVPGPRLHTAPVYAPALVAFVGGGVSVGLSITSGRNSGPGVAWFPLAPGESYRPGYRASPRYFDRVNETVVINRTTVNRNVYINQNVANAVTAVPAAAFVKGRSVAPIARSLRPNEFGKAEVATAAPQLAPVKESILGNARPAGVPAGAHLMQRQVVATVAPPVAPARQDALAQQFAQHPGANIPGVGPALVRQQAATQNPANPNPADGRARLSSQGIDPSGVRLVTGHAQAERRGGMNEPRPSPAPAQLPAIGNVPRAGSAAMPVPAQQEPERRPQYSPGNNGSNPARPAPQPRENPARDLSGNNMQRPGAPSPQPPAAATVSPATVPQPPRQTGGQEYRPTLERRDRETVAPQQQPQPQQQREVPRAQPGINADNPARMPNPPHIAAPVPQAAPQPATPAPMPSRAEPAPVMQPRPLPRQQEAAPPQPQQQVQPPRRMERQEPVEPRREAPPPVPAMQPAPVPMPMPVPAKQEKENKEKGERFNPNQKKTE
ncbi:MAG: DUF6600 domain-containing protein [Pseudomonadota bacterium]